MYKILSLLIILCSTATMGSCQSAKSFEDSKDKTSYLAGLKSKSDKDLQQQLKKDLSFVDTMLDGARNTQLAFSFGMSFSSGDDKDNKSFDAAKPYELKNLKDSLQLVFKQDMQELTMEQRYIYPNSQLQMDYPDKAEGGEVSLSLVKMYAKGAELQQNTVGLKRVDSAEVSLSYVFPTAFERWEISQGDSASYNGETAMIDKMKGKEVEFTMPQSLYRKVLAYQGITKEGKLMDHTSFSAFPVTVVKRSVINDFAATQKLLKKASSMNDAAAALAVLSEIPESVFISKNELNRMKAAIDALDKQESQKPRDLIASIKKMIKDYGSILSPEEQSISLKFPAEVAKVYLYMGKSFDSLTEIGMARNEDTELAPYLSYQDSASTKYGIVDGAGNIIIPATYERALRLQEGTSYFNTYPTGSYYLDATKKKLIEIKNRTYLRSIDKSRTVFQDSLDYMGVMENNDKILIPFEYDKIDELGNMYVVTKSLRGRKHVELLDSKGKIVRSDFVDYVVSEERNCILFKTKSGQTGLMGTDGKYMIAPQDLRIQFIGKGPILAYSTDGQQLGLMDRNGKRLTPEIYYEIEYESDGLLLVESNEDYLKGYIFPDGKVAIAPQFQEAKDFNMGLALIREDDGTWHFIDKKGKVVKSIPKAAGAFEHINGSSNYVMYYFENQSFDAKGNMVK